MWSGLRILLVEDDPRWREVAEEALASLGGCLKIDSTDSKQVALGWIGERSYDIAVVDLSLLGGMKADGTFDREGFSLFERLRSEERGRWTALVLLTGVGGLGDADQAVQHFDPVRTVDKAQFSPQRFTAVVTESLRKARTECARARKERGPELSISYRMSAVSGYRVESKGFLDGRALEPAAPWRVSPLAEDADALEDLICSKQGPELWRPEARRVGEALYRQLGRATDVAASLAALRSQARRFNPLRLELRGPALGLRLPFELMRDNNDFLCFDLAVARRVEQAGIPPAGRGGSFPDLLEELVGRGSEFRVLLVGLNSDGLIPAAAQELQHLKESIEQDLRYLGIKPQVHALSGLEATYSKVRQALEHGGYHLFHYSGHGRHSASDPESSGLVLLEGFETRLLRAAELRVLVFGTPLRFVFLSCCQGATTAGSAGRGDFLGVMEALVRGGVPEILGYRWSVLDDGAFRLAREFYRSLWRTLSPPLALLEARREVAGGEAGRNDDTWASPILVSQIG